MFCNSKIRQKNKNIFSLNLDTNSLVVFSFFLKSTSGLYIFMIVPLQYLKIIYCTFSRQVLKFSNFSLSLVYCQL